MHLRSLHRYPIKACRGHAINSAVVDALGFVGDRRFMLVDSNDRFVSQREAAVLATVTPTFDGRILTVEAPRMETLVLELDPHGASRDVTIWNDQVTATDQGDHAAGWFAEVVGHPCRLVHFGGEATRRLDPRYAPRPDAETAFADGYPVLAVLPGIARRPQPPPRAPRCRWSASAPTSFLPTRRPGARTRGPRSPWATSPLMR